MPTSRQRVPSRLKSSLARKTILSSTWRRARSVMRGHQAPVRASVSLRGQRDCTIHGVKGHGSSRSILPQTQLILRDTRTTTAPSAEFISICGQTLTWEQNVANQGLHQRRRIDHIHSGVKHCRIIKDRSCLWKEGVRALLMERCCALQNSGCVLSLGSRWLNRDKLLCLPPFHHSEQFGGRVPRLTVRPPCPL